MNLVRKKNAIKFSSLEGEPSIVYQLPARLANNECVNNDYKLEDAMK